MATKTKKIKKKTNLKKSENKKSKVEKAKTNAKAKTNINIQKSPLQKIEAIYLVAGLVIGILMMFAYNQTNTGNINADYITQQEAGAIILDIVKMDPNLKLMNVSVQLMNVTEVNGIYAVGIKFSSAQGEDIFNSYITKDGKILFPKGINVEEYKQLIKKVDDERQENDVNDNNDNSALDDKITGKAIKQTDKPNVKLFVMSYCPFGLQAQKAFLQPYKLLKDKADITINFVNYAMHDKKELDENLRQYCIQAEQENKFYDYLCCFAGGDGTDGTYTKCLEEANIDKTKLNSCMTRTDEQYKITEMYNDKSTWSNGRFPMFNVEADLNRKYEIRGSPTLVINDKIVSASRSPEAYKQAICSAFVNPPEECNQKLSEDAASPGFGGGVGTTSSGVC